MRKFTRKHLVSIVASEAKIRNDDAKKITAYVLRALHIFLRDMQVGDTLEIRGLGVFTCKLYRGRRNVRNPKTNERATMPARRRLAFRLSTIIRKAYKKVI
jgi:nucleoid DNA-binding protein